MRKFLFTLYFYLLVLPFDLIGFHYEVSVCAIFKNEASYLQEWIEYHRLLGAEHFWLYNNNSTDHYLDILRPYIQQGIVELIDWPEVMDQKWAAQANAYNDCISRSKRITQWLAIIDIDEFIVPVHHERLSDLLKQYQKAGGLQIFWLFFGTSGIYEIPSSNTLIESLVFRASENYVVNYKTICQPHTVKKCRAHQSEYFEPWFACFPNGEKDQPHLRRIHPVGLDIVRIHHYWTRDEKYFLEQKILRKEQLTKKKFKPEGIQSILNMTHQEFDNTIFKFVPALKQRLQEVTNNNF